MSDESSPDSSPVLAVAPDVVERIVYLGTPDVAVPPLRALHAAGFTIDLVVTRPDKKRGRGGDLSPSPVKRAALDLGLEVTTDLDAIRTVNPDLAAVVAYGRIIPTELLERVPMVNLHFSLLPRWRGAAPVERALLSGDSTTGVCVMAVAPELDTGGVYRRREVAIDADATLDSLRDHLVALGAEMLVDALRVGLGEPEPQVGEPTYAHKITAADLELDWDRSAVGLARVVRLGNAWTTFRGKRFKVWSVGVAEPGSAAHLLDPGAIGMSADRDVLVGTGDGVLVLGEVQPEGKPRRSAADWANGAQPNAADRFGG